MPRLPARRPRLPNATDLSGSGLGPARSFTNIPVPDIAGAARSVAQGVGQVGLSIDNVQKDRREKAAKQERFDTKMGLLRAEEAYAERVRDLNPLAPDYVDQVKRARIETFSPYLSNVKDPENRQYFDLTTGEDFVNIGIKAESAAKQARVENGKMQVADYYDAVTKKALSGEFTGDVRAEVERLIRDNPDFDELTANELTQKYGSAADAVVVDIAFNSMSKNGYTLRPDVNAEISTAEQAGAPSWMGPYLRRLAGVESAGGYKLTTSKSSAGGIYQFTDGTGKQYGLNSFEDKNDAGKATDAAIRLTLDNFKYLKGVLGRDPTPGELYLAHQQGAGGVEKLLANPDRLAATAVGLKAVENNLPKNLQGRAATMTSAEFMQYWGGKFSGDASGGMMDPNETLSVIETLPEYQRLPVDAQIKIREGIAANVEKQNAEAKKSADINTAREAANAAAAGVASLADGYKWLDENIADPEVREKARTMFKSEFEANEKSRETEYKTFVSGVTANVMNAVNSGNTQAALEAIPAQGLDPEDYEKLLERVSKGPVQFDDFKALERLRHLKYADTEQFAEIDLMDYAPVLKQATLDRLIEDQASVRKGLEKTGKLPSLEARSKLLSETYDIMGLDTSKNVRPAVRQANVRTQERIASIFEMNVQMAVDRAGRELQPEELRRVRDETLLEFTRKETKKGWGGDYDEAVQQGLPDVFTLFDEEEQKINAAIEAENKERIAAGQPVENLRSPGSLLRQAQEELATFNAAERRRVTDEIKAIERGLRSPTTAIRDVALDERYIRLQRERQALEEFEINAQTLYEWLAVTLAPQNRNAE